MNYQTIVSVDEKSEQKEFKKKTRFFNQKLILTIKKSAWSAFLIIMILFSNGVNAQKIKDNDGLITLDGKPYVKMVKKTGFFFNNHFWIRNLDGKELVFIEVKEKVTSKWNKEKRKHENTTSYYHIVHFKESGGRVTLDEVLGKRGVIKLIFKNKLIKDGLIDPIAERKYLLKYGGSLHGVKSTALTVIKGDEIFHYDKLLGTFLIQSSTSHDGVSETIILVYNNNGEKVAEAIAPIENAVEWSVYTYRDEKRSFIKYEPSNDREKLFKWISDKKYL